MAQSNGNNAALIGGAVALALTVTSAFIPRESVAHPRGSASPAAAMLTAITTVIHSPPIYDDPDGTCGLCDATTEAASSGSSATVEIYFEDDGEDFTGDFELTLTLDDQSLRYMTIADVSQDDQQTQWYTVGVGSGWDWTDVVKVTVEAVPD